MPPIRPLETLHNALSLRKLDGFLQDMILAQIFKTPTGSPPRGFEPTAAAVTNIPPAVSSLAMTTVAPETFAQGGSESGSRMEPSPARDAEASNEEKIKRKCRHMAQISH